MCAELQLGTVHVMISYLYISVVNEHGRWLVCYVCRVDWRVCQFTDVSWFAIVRVHQHRVVMRRLQEAVIPAFTLKWWVHCMRAIEKYTDLTQPVSVENLGPFSSLTMEFLSDLGHRISHISNDDREVLLLFQRISVTIQRLTLRFCMIPSHLTVQSLVTLLFFNSLFLTLGIFTTRV